MYVNKFVYVTVGEEEKEKSPVMTGQYIFSSLAGVLGHVAPRMDSRQFDRYSATLLTNGCCNDDQRFSFITFDLDSSILIFFGIKYVKQSYRFFIYFFGGGGCLHLTSLSLRALLISEIFWLVCYYIERATESETFQTLPNFRSPNRALFLSSCYVDTRKKNDCLWGKST